MIIEASFSKNVFTTGYSCFSVAPIVRSGEADADVAKFLNR